MKFVNQLIRPFIAVSFVGTVVTLTLLGKIEPSEVLQTAGIIVGVYFGERAALKTPGNDN